ncbi:MAG: DNA replication and repair protein RecF [Bacteroidetes bacterium]|nr:DNA replication and repair protein RecF [Bacteroidota bacterium]
MILTSIHLKNFRSHKNTNLDFSDELNYIVGGNGQGKTSILEAIYYLCTTKNSNSKSDSEVVKFNEEEFEIEGEFKNLTQNTARIFYSLKENKKYYFQNGKQISRSADIIGKFPVVLLTPTDHSITQGSPSDRRKFVDSVISQASETYLNFLLDYNKTLRQRSTILNLLRETQRRELFGELDAWTQKLVRTGTEIIKRRKVFIEEFNSFIKESYKLIMEEDEVPEILYFFLNGYGGNEIEKDFEVLISERIDEEIRRASNLFGPHRDDFIFKINDITLKDFGSQGQHKTFQTALRFAQYFYLKEKIGRQPLFLLDDVFGELDTKRSIKISEYLKNVGQAFITLTDFTNYNFLKKNDKDRRIILNNGEISYA